MELLDLEKPEAAEAVEGADANISEEIPVGSFAEKLASQQENAGIQENNRE